MKLGSVFIVMLHSCLFHLTYSSNLNSGDTDHANGSESPIDEETGRSKYCRYCGSEISTDSLLCPYCDRRQEEIQQPQTAIQTGKGFRGWIVKNLRTLRISLFFIYFGILFLGLLIGSQIPLSTSDAESIVRELEQSIEMKPTPLYIAANNISICLLCFPPIFGILQFVFVGYNMGILISAMATSYSMSAPQLFFMNFLNPFIWIESAALTLATTQGTMFLLGLLTRRLKEEGKNLLIAVLICLLVLGLSAVIESALITSLNEAY